MESAPAARYLAAPLRRSRNLAQPRRDRWGERRLFGEAVGALERLQRRDHHLVERAEALLGGGAVAGARQQVAQPAHVRARRRGDGLRAGGGSGPPGGRATSRSRRPAPAPGWAPRGPPRAGPRTRRRRRRSRPPPSRSAAPHPAARDGRPPPPGQPSAPPAALAEGAALRLRLLEGTPHRLHHLGTGEDVPLHAVVGARAVPRPGQRAVAGEGRRCGTARPSPRTGRRAPRGRCGRTRRAPGPACVPAPAAPAPAA
jgi:hypothetical protein